MIRRLSVSGIQALIGMLAGVATIAGAVFSVAEYARPAKTGQLVAVVQDAASHQPVSGATVEILTTEDAIIATLSPDSTGRATEQLREAVYIVRVSHPRYAPETRRIRVLARETTEIRTTLNPLASSSRSVERTVNRGVSAVRKALGF